MPKAESSAKAYRVLKRLSWSPFGTTADELEKKQRKAAPCPHPTYDECDVIKDLLPESIPWLLEQGLIEPYTEKKQPPKKDEA